MKTPLTLLAGAILASVSALAPLMVAHAAKYPNPLVTDARVKQVAYDPNQVYEVVGTYGYQTSIEFAGDETVKVVTLGDSIAWQTVPYQNRIFIKPVEPNAATNMTVITDRRTYYFKLGSGNASSKSKAGETYLVRFVYPSALQYVPGESGRGKGSTGAGVAASRHGSPAGASIAPPRVNMDYSTSGESSAIPLSRVFDDGQFTYFEFAKNGERNAEIPMVYTVGADGTESLVNTRREGSYLVAEKTVGRFTLRNGEAYLCVQNNRMAGRQTAASPRNAEAGGPW